jgi:hypothetical protein
MFCLSLINGKITCEYKLIRKSQNPGKKLKSNGDTSFLTLASDRSEATGGHVSYHLESDNITLNNTICTLI